MAYNWSVLLLTTALITLVLVNCEESSVKPSYETDACPGCRTRHSSCCGGAISNYFRSSQFENIFSNRNSLEVDAHEVGFWDYQSFITASADYQPYGFGTTYRKLLGMKELAAFLAHVATKTSCGSKVDTREPLACGLCYNKEMNSSSNYCDEHYRTGFRPDGKEKGKVENAKNGDAEKGIPQHIPKKMANQELSKESELKEGKNEKKRKWDLPSDGYRTCSVCKRVK